MSNPKDEDMKNNVDLEEFDDSFGVSNNGKGQSSSYSQNSSDEDLPGKKRSNKA